MSLPPLRHDMLCVVHVDGEPVGVAAFNVASGWVEIYTAGGQVERRAGKIEVRVVSEADE